MLDLQSKPRMADIDGSILWIIEEYKHTDWMHTLTRLNAFCFLVNQETEYVPYIDVVARKSGPYCSNLTDFISYYESNGWVVSDVRNNGRKRVFRLTDEGVCKVDELVSDEQVSILSSCLSEWDEKSNLALMDDLYVEYPEYVI